MAAKKRYETTYANKAKYTREKAADEKKQQLINSINTKKSELKKQKRIFQEERLH